MCSFCIHPCSSSILDKKEFRETINFLENLIFSEIDSKDGIRVTVDEPCGNKPLLNVNRPQVMRQEYGESVNSSNRLSDKISNSQTQVDRFFYGNHGNKHGYNQVGTWPQDQFTRPMPPVLRNLGKLVLEKVMNSIEFNFVQHQKIRSVSKIKFKEFNHVSILLYYGMRGYKETSSLNYHCDNSYSGKGKFCNRTNIQEEDTPTVTLTIGSSRKIKYRRRLHKSGKWVVDKSFSFEEVLRHGTIGVVHPDDERPFRFNVGDGVYMAQYQHGGIRVGDGLLSICLAFRTVTTTAKFDIKTNQRIFDDEPSILKDIEHDNLHSKIDKKKFHGKLKDLYMDNINVLK